MRSVLSLHSHCASFSYKSFGHTFVVCAQLLRPYNLIFCTFEFIQSIVALSLSQSSNTIYHLRCTLVFTSRRSPFPISSYIQLIPLHPICLCGVIFRTPQNSYQHLVQPLASQLHTRIVTSAFPSHSYIFVLCTAPLSAHQVYQQATMCRPP